MAIKGRFPTTKPSLDLNFAKTKRLDPRITFTRASSGSYVGSDGLIKMAAANEARFDHSPVTGESLGLLIEEQKTNLLLQSAAISLSSPWFPQSTAPTVAANATAAPDGSITATRVTFAAADSRIFQNVSATSGTTYTLSVYVKPVTDGTLNVCRLAFYDGANQSNSGDFTLSPGWQRISYTITAGNTASNASFQLRNHLSGSAANDIYAWGAQLEAGAFPTSYIPTSASTVTRSADVASISGTAFSSWYRQDEGSFYAETIAAPGVIIASQGVFGVDDGTSSTNYFAGRPASRGFRLISRVSGSIDADMTIGIQNDSALARTAYGIKTNDYALFASTGVSSFDTSALVPPGMNNIKIGNHVFGGYWGGTIRRIAYWKQRLSNDILRELTR